MNKNSECSFPNARVSEMNTLPTRGCPASNNNYYNNSSSRSSSSEKFSSKTISGHNLPVHKPSELVDDTTKIIFEQNKNGIVDKSGNNDFTNFPVIDSDQNKANDHPHDNTKAYLKAINKEPDEDSSIFLRTSCQRKDQIYKNHMDLKKEEGTNTDSIVSCLNSSPNRSNENLILDTTVISNVSNKRENERDTSENIGCNKTMQSRERIETIEEKPQQQKYEKDATFENFMNEFVRMPEDDDGEESEVADSERYKTWSNSTEVCYTALFETIRRNVEEERKSQEQEQQQRKVEVELAENINAYVKSEEPEEQQRKVEVGLAENINAYVKSEEPEEQNSFCEENDTAEEKMSKPIEQIDPQLMEGTYIDSLKEEINNTGTCIETSRSMGKNLWNQKERENGTVKVSSNAFNNMLNVHNTENREKRKTQIGNDDVTMNEISNNGVQGFIDNSCNNIENNVMYNNSNAIINTKNSLQIYQMDKTNMQKQNTSHKKRKRKNISNSVMKRGSIFKHEYSSNENIARAASLGNALDMFSGSNHSYSTSYNNNINNNNIINNNMSADHYDNNYNNNNNSNKNNHKNNCMNNSTSSSSFSSNSSQPKKTGRSNYKHADQSNIMESYSSHDDLFSYQIPDMSKECGTSRIPINNKHNNKRNGMNVYASDMHPCEKLRYQFMSNNNISSNESSPSNNDAVSDFRNSFSYDDINNGRVYNEQTNFDAKGQFMDSCNKMNFSSNMYTANTIMRHTQQWFDMIYTVCVRLDDLCCNLNANCPHSMHMWENSNGYNADNLKSLIFNKDLQQTLDNKRNDSSDINNTMESRMYNSNINLLSNNMNMATDKFNENLNGNDINNFSNVFMNTNYGSNSGVFDDKPNISQNQIYKYPYMGGIKYYPNEEQTNHFPFANSMNMTPSDTKQNSTDKRMDWRNVFNKTPMGGQVNQTNCKYVEYVNSKKMNIIENNKMDTMSGESFYDYIKNNVSTNGNSFLFNKNNILQSNMNKMEMKVEPQSIMSQHSAVSNKEEMKHTGEENSHPFLKNRIQQMDSGLMYSQEYSSAVNDYPNDSSQSETIDQQKDKQNAKMPGKSKVRKNTKISNTSNNEEKKKKKKKKNIVNKKVKTVKTESEFEYLLYLSDKEGPSSENPDDLKCDVAGVYWDKRSWIASWYDNGKRYYKSFSAKTHGFYKSKFCAIKVRLSKVKGQTIFGKSNHTKRNSNKENSSNENIAAENNAINIQSNRDYLLQQQHQHQQQQQPCVNMRTDVNRSTEFYTPNDENVETKINMNLINDIDTIGCESRNHMDCIHLKTESDTKLDINNKVDHTARSKENKNNFNQFTNAGNIFFTL